MRRWLLGDRKIVRVYRGLWRVVASSVRSIGGRALPCSRSAAGRRRAARVLPWRKALSEQQIRCMQLQQELACAPQGGGGNSDDLARIDQQIAQTDRVFQGTQAAMEDAGCFESFFIFGRGLVRSPKCLKHE